MVDLSTLVSGQRILIKRGYGRPIQAQDNVSVVFVTSGGTAITINGITLDSCNGDDEGVNLLNSIPEEININDVDFKAYLDALDLGFKLEEMGLTRFTDVL
jgi:hypothetical protein